MQSGEAEKEISNDAYGKRMVNAAFFVTVHGVIAIAMLHQAKKKNRTPLLAISCKKHSTQLSIIFPS